MQKMWYQVWVDYFDHIGDFECLLVMVKNLIIRPYHLESWSNSCQLYVKYGKNRVTPPPPPALINVHIVIFSPIFVYFAADDCYLIHYSYNLSFPGRVSLFYILTYYPYIIRSYWATLEFFILRLMKCYMLQLFLISRCTLQLRFLKKLRLNLPSLVLLYHLSFNLKLLPWKVY